MASSLKAGAKAVARGMVGAMSPRLLRRVQLGRAQQQYLREPTAGPRRLLLEPTTGCNHRCEMCWDHSPRLEKATPGRHMPFEQIESLLEEMAAMGTEEVWMAGRGEPLVHPKAAEIFQLVGSLGMRSLITTNAARLDEELADQLCEWGLQQLSVSIDSGNAETYARIHHGPPEDRARILGLMKKLSQRGEGKPALLASMVVSKLNCTELLDFVREAIEAGVSALVVGGMRPVPFDSTDLSLGEEDWARLREDLAKAQEMADGAGVELRTDNIRPAEKPRAQTWPYEEMACFIGHTFTVIDVEGVVHGCCTCQNRLGSLREASFREIWQARPYRMFRQALREMPSTRLTPPRCECRHGCGHVPENAAIQRELGFEFAQRVGESDFATRVEVARVLCRELGSVLPAPKEGAEFADLGPDRVDEATRRDAARLRRLGIVVGTGSMDGAALFEPQRMVAREEFEQILKRALSAAGISGEQAEGLIGASRPGSGHPAEPVTRKALEAWVGELARLVAAPK